MPDTSPSPSGPIGTVIDRLEVALGELNVGLAYAPDVPNRADHLLTVQNLSDALDDLRGDV